MNQLDEIINNLQKELQPKCSCGCKYTMDCECDYRVRTIHLLRYLAELYEEVSFTIRGNKMQMTAWRIRGAESIPLSELSRYIDCYYIDKDPLEQPEETLIQINDLIFRK